MSHNFNKSYILFAISLIVFLIVGTLLFLIWLNKSLVITSSLDNYELKVEKLSLVPQILRIAQNTGGFRNLGKVLKNRMTYEYVFTQDPDNEVGGVRYKTSANSPIYFVVDRKGNEATGEIKTKIFLNIKILDLPSQEQDKIISYSFFFPLNSTLARESKMVFPLNHEDIFQKSNLDLENVNTHFSFHLKSK